MRTLSAPLASRAPGLTARARVTPRRGARTAAPVRAALDKNGRRDYYAENYEYYKDKEITNAMLVGALVPAVASCAASFQLAMSAEATAAWFMSAAGLANGVEILDMEYSTGLALRSAPPVAVDDNAYDMDGDDFYDCEIMSIRCAA